MKKQNKTINSKQKSFLLEYEKEISKISKYLSRRVNDILLEELQMYPLEIIDCVKKANKLFKKQKIRNTSILVGVKNIDEIVNKIVKSPKDFLLLLSYCSKPIHCPFGRFNKKCEPLTRSTICNECPFKKIILKAKKINCQYYIVTKDYLMLNRYLLPRFHNFKNSKKYQPLIVTGCPLAVNRFHRLAVIFGSIGIAYKFISGSCKNSKDYQKAELGEKRKVTKLSQKNWREINYILDKAFKKIQYKKYKYK